MAERIAANGGRLPLLVCETEAGVVGWTAVSAYRPRACSDGIEEFSVDVDRAWRGRGVGRALLEALIAQAAALGYWKLVSRIFPDNTASRALCRSCGFREVGTYAKHGRLAGRWADVVIVERLVPENQSQEVPRIRPAQAADLDPVLALLVAARLPAAGVRAALGHFTVAEAAGDVVGTAGTEPCGPCVLLRSVAVLPVWRGQGVGTALVEAALAAARRKGARTAYLLTETAEAFFARHGFRRLPRDAAPAAMRASTAFMSQCCSSAVCMTADL